MPTVVKLCAFELREIEQRIVSQPPAHFHGTRKSYVQYTVVFLEFPQSPTKEFGLTTSQNHADAIPLSALGLMYGQSRDYGRLPQTHAKLVEFGQAGCFSGRL